MSSATTCPRDSHRLTRLNGMAADIMVESRQLAAQLSPFAADADQLECNACSTAMTSIIEVTGARGEEIAARAIGQTLADLLAIYDVTARIGLASRIMGYALHCASLADNSRMISDRGDA